PWLAEHVLALQARAADWPAARDTIADAGRRGALPAGRARRGRGVVLYELSREAEQKGDLRRAAALAARAQILLPDLAEAAAQHARLLLAMQRDRAASRSRARLSRSRYRLRTARQGRRIAAPRIAKPRCPGEPSRNRRGGAERAAMGRSAPPSRDGGRRRTAGRSEPAALSDDGAARRQRTR